MLDSSALSLFMDTTLSHVQKKCKIWLGVGVWHAKPLHITRFEKEPTILPVGVPLLP